MLTVLGIAVVFAAVFGGYLLEQGNPWVLLQPAEILIVGGAAFGIILAANPPAVMRKMWKGARELHLPPAHTESSYLRTLRLLYELFSFAQRSGGVGALEAHIEDPNKSAVFRNHPEFLADQVTRSFLCDSIRMLILGSTTPQRLDHLMDLDMEVQRRCRQEPISALSSIADSLPGLGIVAAVLGVVVTMQSIGGSPESVGQKVAAALVGTFLGILFCYGVVGPLAARLEHRSEAEDHFQQVLRAALVAFAEGASPILAVEYGRRSIPLEVRPAFELMETTIRRERRIPPLVPVAAGEANGDGTTTA